MTKVFIYCDNHNTRIPVRDFVHTEGRWYEVGNDSAVRVAPGAQSGLGIVLIGPGSERADDYRLYDLRCRHRRCRRNVPVREDKLSRALDGFAAAGMSSVPLRLLAASLKHV